MRNHHSSFRRRHLWIFSAALALVLLAPSVPAAADDTRENPPPRSRANDPRTPSPPQAAPSPPPAPSPSPGGPGSSTGSPGTGGSGRGGYHRGGHYGYPYGYGHRYFGFGYQWPYSRFYWDYHRPYYPWGLVWYPAYPSDTRVGALDLSVKPKKTEVYVDGEYVGTAGKFDGYPGYLWLTEGSHQLVFHREGWQTVARKVSVRSGPVRRLKLALAEGPTTPPEELFEAAPRAAAASERPRPSRAAPPVAPTGERPEREAAMDVRGEPGRFRLEVTPLDASVYLDGRFLGSAEELARLHAGMLIEPGEHFLDVQRPGYRSERVRFSVTGGDETEVKVDLASTEG